jgi:predicted nucleic acid-binding protein
MTDKVFIDTNILVYLFDLSKKEKRIKAIDLINSLVKNSQLFISVQVLNEFVNVVTKKIDNKLSLDETIIRLEFIKEIFTISDLKYKTTISAMNIQSKYGFSFWDSLIISSAIGNGCNLVYSEDFQHNQIVEEKLTITNPFKLL